MKHLNAHAVVAVAVTALTLLVWLLLTATGAFAADPSIVQEVERDGVDALYAAIAAAITGAIGLYLKRPQDYMAERRASRHGEPDERKMDIAQVALDSIRAHELACEEYRRETKGEMDKLHARISSVKDDVAETKRDVAVIRAILEERRESA